MYRSLKIISSSSAILQIKSSYTRTNYNSFTITALERALRDLVQNENNVTYLCKAFELLKKAPLFPNDHRINEQRSALVAKACLLASGVAVEVIPANLNKIELIWSGFHDATSLAASNILSNRQKIHLLNTYLWKQGEGRNSEDIYKFNEVLDNQLSYLSGTDLHRSVGNCTGLTALFTVLSIRLGVNVDTVFTEGHVLSAHKGLWIEHTNTHGINDIDYSYTMTTSEIGVIASIYNSKGVEYIEQGDPEQAILHLNKAIELVPLHANGYVNRGGANMRINNIEQAFHDFNTAIALNPTSATAFHNRGAAYMFIRDHEKALFDHSRAIELDPSNAISYYYRGNLHFTTQNYQQAISDYDKAIELNPNSVYAYNNRGGAYLHLSDAGQAIADISKAIELNPHDTYIQNNLDHALLIIERSVKND